MNIFLDSIQDEDSYIFLNAVQGLSALASHAGRDTLKNVLAVYTKGLDHLPVSQLSKRDVDVRLRIGEALSNVIRQLNEVLPAYSDILIPPLFNLVGEKDVPTLLRISSISVLTQCVDTNSQAVSTYRPRMLNAMLDLLHIESLQAQKQISPNSAGISNTDNQPTTTDPKVAEFRRAALHLLGMLIKSSVLETFSREEEFNRPTMKIPTISLPSKLPNKPTDALEDETRERMSVVLGYISATDVDSVVRFMAKELLEMMHSS